MGKVKITLKASTIDRSKKQKATVEALGLKRINQVVEHNVTPQIQGMIDRVAHLITVENV